VTTDGTSDSEATLDAPEPGSRDFPSPVRKIEELNMKLSTLLAAASIAALSLTTSAIAQNPAQQPAAPAARDAAAPAMNFKNAWRSSKLIGLDVYNRADEKLGDINEILLDKEGKVMAVVIGVGGFLGMGEHDIAVSMDKLKFMEEPHTSKSAKTNEKTTTTTTTTGTTATTTRRETTTDFQPDHAVMDATKDQLKAMKQFKYSDYN
jgi:hypothetical protein